MTDHHIGRNLRHVVIAKYPTQRVIVRTAFTFPENAEKLAESLRNDPNVTELDIVPIANHKDRKIIRVFY